tara:strand:+ start:8272 stop:8574 length:303 start_codon:yes stop_codon:yes gene_type:complete
MPPKKSATHEMPDGSTMKDSDMPKKKGGRPKKMVVSDSVDPADPVEPVKSKAKAKAPAKAKAKGGDWKGHLAKTFAAGKKSDPKYKYSQAMKDAAKTYSK